jgi:hypothetical protein
MTVQYITVQYIGSCPCGPAGRLRVFNADPDSEHDYPVAESLQRGNRLFFAEPFDKLVVEYETYGTRLKVRSDLVRGHNPSRSPRVIAGHWENR